MTRRSPNYRFTVTDKNDPRVAELKAQIKELNKSAEWVESDPRSHGWCTHYKTTYTVRLKARIGSRGPEVKAALGDLEYRRLSTAGAIPHWAAERFDVYVNKDTERRRDADLYEAYLERNKKELARKGEFERERARAYLKQDLERLFREGLARHGLEFMMEIDILLDSIIQGAVDEKVSVH